MAVAKSLNGAALKLLINGRVFGIATSLEWNIETGRRPIYGLDQTAPFELAPGPFRITGTIQCIRVRLDGGLEGRGIAAQDSNILLEKYVSILLLDRLSDSVILKIDNAAVNNQKWMAGNNQVVKGSFSFDGLGFENEAGQ